MEKNNYCTQDWFQIAASHEIEKGKVSRRRYFNTELVLFRGSDGVARVADAYCPHIGAHLGVGGTVEENCIRCPFHGWKFDGDGACISIPYSEKIPSKAKLATWPTVERDGMIFIRYDGDRREPNRPLSKVEEFVVGSFSFSSYPNSWFQVAWSDELPRQGELKVRVFGTELLVCREKDHGLRAWDSQDSKRIQWPVCERNKMIFVYHHRDRQLPSFDIPELNEVSSYLWTPVGRLEWNIKCRFQELIENSADLGHFKYLHGFSEQAQLVRFETQGHTYSVTVSAPKKILGVAKPCELTISYVGMGFGVGRLEVPINFINIVTCLPIDLETIRVRFTMFARIPRVPILKSVLSRVLAWHTRRDVEQEMTILENKKYLQRPLLVRADGPILRLRQWCKQF